MTCQSGELYGGVVSPSQGHAGPEARENPEQRLRVRVRVGEFVEPVRGASWPGRPVTVTGGWDLWLFSFMQMRKLRLGGVEVTRPLKSRAAIPRGHASGQGTGSPAPHPLRRPRAGVREGGRGGERPGLRPLSW